MGDGAFDGFTNLETVYYPQDTTVSENAFPENVTQVEYSETEDGVIITDIKPGDVVSEDGKVVIPDNIGGKDVVAVDEDVRDLVSPDEGHDHNFENGNCPICGAPDPDREPVVTEPTVTEPTGSSPTGTSPVGTAPSIPSRPSAPSNPSSPAVTTAAVIACAVLIKKLIF
ncbi:MAG: hypothetical protein K2J76_09100 [Oscillospiraceae bacterium]|nr:hypothetical protein [Oscillospiraceae bacterium]